MDLVKVRKSFPHLQIMGGIPKGELKYGRDRIDRALKPVEEIIKEGGYIPFAVSYTHLDVYKRQILVLWRLLKPPF